ncbi:MAG TPA: SDR family oxidoreductase [Arenimonas sp.]|nr:SDR family oxidoreductase [Arenimonas sp.]
MSNLKGKTVFITGASRGIGLAIAIRAARDGANVVIAAKSDVPNPKLPGTIHSAAAAVAEAGGKALAIRCDIREEDQVKAAVSETVETFGGIDILVNNASAIWLRGTLDTPMKRFDLMSQVNSRGTFLCSQICLPHLLKAENPHILTLAPPINLDPKWWAPHTGYTLAKMGMSFVTLGLAEEFKDHGIRSNCLALGSVDTDMLRAAFPEFQARTTAEEMGTFIAVFTLNGHKLFNGKVLPVASTTP